MAQIANVNMYLKGLNKGIEDKLFFLHKIDAAEYDTVIEFGSGSGIILYTASNIFDSYVDMIGIENNLELLIASRFKCLDKDNVRFYENIDKLNINPNKRKKTLLILSSILHELDEDGVKDVNTLIQISDTVVVRDMQSPKTYDISHISKEIMDNIIDQTPMYMLNDFHEKFGQIFDNKINLHQFLLRYTYVDNWNSELEEDYFRGDLLIHNNTIELSDDFYIFFSENFMLPHQVKQIKDKFGYVLDEPTHFKRIYHRKQRY